jgi:4-hydroxybenzoate polyprenyltransferase
VILLGILKTMRPKQWVKNLFVLAPVVFAKNLFHEQVLLRAVAAFAAFSLLAGAVYMINDLVDVEDDRRHPTKRNRPIASGEVSPAVAKSSAALLVLGSLSGAFWLDWRVGAAAAVYLAQNLAYSLKLKQYAYLDVVSIALGFVLRVVAGCYAVSTPTHPVVPSLYLLGCTASLALFLGFGKRYHELMVNESRARNSLRQYNPRTLKATLWITAVVTVATYLAWTLDPPLQLAFAQGYLWTTTPFVLLAMGRFVRLLDSEHGESPTDAMLKDVPFVLTVIAWTMLMLTLIYRLRPT